MRLIYISLITLSFLSTSCQKNQTKTIQGSGEPLLIQLQDLNQNDFSSDTYKGKYVLVDFWASWCLPCRKEIPKLKKLYETYHNKGLEMLSISIDKKEHEAAWKEAAKTEDMPWTQVVDFDGVKYAKPLGIKAIPYTLVLDQEGRILYKNLHGAALADSLSSIFKP